MDGHKPPKLVWASPLGPLTDPTPGADQVSVIWRHLLTKSRAIASNLRSNTAEGIATAKRCASNATATVKWAKDLQDFTDHSQELQSWASSLETAVAALDAEWVDRLGEVATKHGQKQCSRNRSKQHALWVQHFRHGGPRLASGYAPTRRAFQYARGPTGWTPAPVAAASCEDEIPEIETDHHDDHLVKAAELYHAQDGTLTHAQPPAQQNVTTVLSLQAEVEAGADKWAAEWKHSRTSRRLRQRWLRRPCCWQLPPSPRSLGLVLTTSRREHSASSRSRRLRPWHTSSEPAKSAAHGLKTSLLCSSCYCPSLMGAEGPSGSTQKYGFG